MPCHSRLGNIEGEKGGKRKRRERVANHGVTHGGRKRRKVREEDAWGR